MMIDIRPTFAGQDQNQDAVLSERIYGGHPVGNYH